MPRPRQRSNDSLTPGQASYVLERLIADRRISPGEVSRYVSDMGREIEELARKLDSLRAAHGGSGAAPARRPGRPPRAAASPEAERAGRPSRKRRRGGALTPEQKASRQLQGRYLGLIRQIPATRRPQYQRTAKEKGREAAIKDMMAALGK